DGRPNRREFGLAPDLPADGARSLLVFTAISAAAMLAVGAAAGALAVPRDYGHWLLRQALPLALGQQILLQVAIAPRVARLGFSGRTTPLIAAFLFALGHLPNPILFTLTFLAGWWWTRWFAIHRNLLPLWASHVMLAATCFAAFDGGEWLRRMRVGAGWIYFFTNP
ncbi:MAG TPA: CPBP family intramembrane glutamic endopeptidase, partial [Planctomycetia bacterium]|nr:CPBP family intramembrane glutamic endopeptidase [Planctomycetia bacterium]